VRVGSAHLLVNGLDGKHPQGSHAPHPPALHGRFQPLPASRKPAVSPARSPPPATHRTHQHVLGEQGRAQRQAMSYEWLRLPAGKAESANCQLTIMVAAMGSNTLFK